MRRNHYHWSLAGLIIALLALVACQTAGPATEPRLTYTVGECDQSIPPDQLADWAQVDITVHDGVVQVHQNINYVCCAEIKIEWECDGNVIKLIETNVGDVCRCICGYEANAEISALPAGHYTIQVWGVAYPDYHPLELLGEAQVDL